MTSLRPPRPSLDPPPEEMRRLARLAADAVADYLGALRDLPVASPGTAADFAALVDEPLPEEGRGIEDGIRFFLDRVAPRMTRVNHPRFHAYIPCPSSFAGTVGAMLAAGTNPFTGSWLGGATLCSLELTVLRWIAQLVGYPEDAAGILTSGGSGATLVALAAARARYGPETLARGRIYRTEEAHASLDKAAALLGYPPEALRTVPMDDELRMLPGELDRLATEDAGTGALPFLVVASAGTVNTGAVDPLPDIAEVCARRGLWLHVDGAYGGFAAIAEEGRRLLAGMERADSLTLDPHKWLYAPMGTGCAFVRDESALRSAFTAHGEYLRDLPPDEVNFLDRGPELSRPGRVLGAWMVVRSAGRRELARQIEADLALARLAAELIEEDPGLELLGPPTLSIVAFRHAARPGEPEEERAARDRRLMDATLRDGTLMLSTTNVRGRSALRLVVMNHRTGEEDVRCSVARIRELAG